jgi:hypothetical protein
MEKLWLRSRKPKLTAVGIRCAEHATLLTAKVATNFADKRRSLGQYSSLADYRPRRTYFTTTVLRKYLSTPENI